MTKVTTLVLLICLCGITQLEAFHQLIGHDQFVRLIGSNDLKALEASFGANGGSGSPPGPPPGSPPGPPPGPPPNGAPRGSPPPGMQQRGPPGVGGQRRGPAPNPANANGTASG